jgi:phosphocarrier protein HPr
MLEAQVSIVNTLGLHARAAAKFVHLAARYSARVKVTCLGREMDGKSIMGLLLLAAAKGSLITIAADGEDAHAALDALVALVRGGFGEEA